MTELKLERLKEQRLIDAYENPADDHATGCMRVAQFQIDADLKVMQEIIKEIFEEMELDMLPKKADETGIYLHFSAAAWRGFKSKYTLGQPLPKPLPNNMI